MILYEALSVRFALDREMHCDEYNAFFMILLCSFILYYFILKKSNDCHSTSKMVRLLLHSDL